jgi:hypothetical protein
VRLPPLLRRRPPPARRGVGCMRRTSQKLNRHNPPLLAAAPLAAMSAPLSAAPNAWGLVHQTMFPHAHPVEVKYKRLDIGGVTVATGDYAIADASGVVFIPAADIERLLSAAEMIAGREAAMTKALLAGKPITEVMGADYEHMLK